MTIKWDEFPKVLDEVVAEKGEDFVYDIVKVGGCLYQHKGSPCCLIGRVLDRLGVPYDSEWEGTAALSIIDNLGAPYEIALAGDRAQGVQDDGEPWGAARRAFHAVLNQERTP